MRNFIVSWVIIIGPRKDLRNVNWWSLTQIQCQQESPIWGGKWGHFIQGNQFNCDTAQLWNSMTERKLTNLQLNYDTEHGYEVAWGLGIPSLQLPSALHSKTVALVWCCSLVPLWQHGSTPLWSGKTASMLQVQPGKHSLVERESLYPWVREELTYTEGSPCPWLVCLHANEDSKSSVWLVQKALSWLVKMVLLWLISEDANEYRAARLLLNKESLSPIGWNTIPWTPL